MLFANPIPIWSAQILLHVFLRLSRNIQVVVDHQTVVLDITSCVLPITSVLELL